MAFIIILLIIIFITYILIVILSSSNNGSTKINNIHDQETIDLINEALRGSKEFQRKNERFIRKLEIDRIEEEKRQRANIEKERKERLIHDRKLISTTSRLTEEGLELYRSRNDNEAIKCFEKCLEYSYPSWVAFYKLMDIYRERKDYKNELRVIERSVEILLDDNRENSHISEYPIKPLIDRLNEVDKLIINDSKGKTINYISWKQEDQIELETLQKYNKKQGEILSNVADTNNKGIEFEKQGNIDEAIHMYEENIALREPALHAYWRLIRLYRKRRDYYNELRVINIAIDVFMKENERRANLVIEEHPEWEDIIMQAMETNEEVRLDNGRYILNQYNVFELIDRSEKVKKLIQKLK